MARGAEDGVGGGAAYGAGVLEGGVLRPRARLDRDEALCYLGYAGQPLDDGLRTRFEELACACEADLQPACVWTSFAVEGEGEGRRAPGESLGAPQVALAGASLDLPGRAIARHLRGARRVALLACTLGAESERRLRLLSALSATDALLYGAAASALVEAAANEAERSIARAAVAAGLCAGTRFSPGYADLPLSIQPAFLSALDATRRIGLSATRECLLVPAKSITAVIGLFDADAVPPDARDQCGACARYEGCPLREKGTTCHGR